MLRADAQGDGVAAGGLARRAADLDRGAAEADAALAQRKDLVYAVAAVFAVLFVRRPSALQSAAWAEARPVVRAGLIPRGTPKRPP
ncbi:hypothetical protein [Streptomyces sp. NPDC056883]|uniref:hypothetical protein n=1 Tax=Streptomyces sp. NPDC056883 TaxID=3345959 RepID=UPI003682416E